MRAVQCALATRMTMLHACETQASTARLHCSRRIRAASAHVATGNRQHVHLQLVFIAHSHAVRALHLNLFHELFFQLYSSHQFRPSLLRVCLISASVRHTRVANDCESALLFSKNSQKLLKLPIFSHPSNETLNT